MLCKHNIMDYSLLLGIENKYFVADDLGIVQAASGRKQTKRSKLPPSELKRIARHIYHSPDQNQTFHVSIIDFLQQWNCNKKTENFLKTKFKGANPSKLSAIEP